MPWFLGLPWTSRARDRLKGCHTPLAGAQSALLSPVTSLPAAIKMPKGTILKKPQTTQAGCKVQCPRRDTRQSSSRGWAKEEMLQRTISNQQEGDTVDLLDMGAAVHGMLRSEVTRQMLWALTQPHSWCGSFPSSAGASSCMSTHQCPQPPASVTGDRNSRLAGTSRVALNPSPLRDLQQKHKAKNPPPSNQPRQDDPTQIFKRQLHPPAPPVWLT